MSDDDFSLSADDDVFSDGEAFSPLAKPAAKPAAKPTAKPKKKPGAPLASSAANNSSGSGGGGGAPAKKAAKKAKASPGASRAAQYQKLTLYEQILVRPDTYIGSIERVNERLYVLADDATGRMEERDIEFVPGLFKIFDEILVNAADNYQRDRAMSTLKVTIDEAAGSISVLNNGAGIPVEMHAKEQMMVPEMIFGNLLTSSNYNDDEKRVTGGRNGFGAKLTNIFSDRFVCETADARRGKSYKQAWTKNMKNCGTAVIKELPAKQKDYTKITFVPDLERFGMTHLESDIVALMKKRVYDIAGCLPKVKVYLNGKYLPIKSFADYCDLYILEENAQKKYYERVNDRWEVCVAMSNGQPQQVSFVNSICTTKGGTHVNHVLDRLVKPLQEALNKKKAAREANIKPHQIKQHIFVFVNALIENPTFDSQTKDALTLQTRKFGSSCDLSSQFISKVIKSGIVELISQWAQFKQKKAWERQGGAPKTRGRVSGIAKLDDANDAGSRRSNECTLILTEGDSAKSLAQAGISVVGADTYGAFPLKGKLLNVRDASLKQLMANEEVNNIIKILGLKKGAKYTDTKSLRYGHLMIMADQDHDGSHIKGLVINMIHKLWPSLLHLVGFMQAFVTPIVKAKRGAQEVTFFSMPQYNEWKARHNNGHGWKIKYYKGLGTSTDAEAKEYFANLDAHQVDFKYTGEPCDEAIDLAFGKQHADRRKEWMAAHDPEAYVDHTAHELDYKTFIDKELVLFSVADCARSIPCVVDGLKVGQRKVLYVCLKRKLTDDYKVAQLAGAVANKAAYHHGENSLQMTIVNMAQHYVGANNVNLLYPSGMFGTRRLGGKDAASARYIYTRLSSITRTLFQEADDDVLEYLDDDGYPVEPKWYMPIIPMILVNGADGIGTGWSTSIPNYNPRDCIDNMRRLLKGEPLEEMTPWYKGFEGTIEYNAAKKNYTVTGAFERVDDNTLLITELPLRTWTQTYKEWLEQGVTGTDKVKQWIKDYRENHTENTVRFEITTVAALPKGRAELIKKFRLSTTLSTSNMVAFDARGRIKRYASASDIVREFYELRLITYRRRKQHLTEQLEKEYVKLDNKVRFILAVISGELVVSSRAKRELIAQLRRDNYAPFPPENKKAKKLSADEDEAESESVFGGPAAGDGDGADAEVAESDADFNYLLSMPLWALTKERVEKLTAERDDKQEQLAALLKKDVKEMWVEELDELAEQLDVFVAEQAAQDEQDAAIRAKVARKKGKGAKAKTKAADDEWRAPPRAKKPAKAAAASSAAPVKLTQTKLTSGGGGGGGGTKRPLTKRDSDHFAFDEDAVLSLSDSDDDKKPGGTRKLFSVSSFSSLAAGAPKSAAASASGSSKRAPTTATSSTTSKRAASKKKPVFDDELSEDEMSDHLSISDLPSDDDDDDEPADAVSDDDSDDGDAFDERPAASKKRAKPATARKTATKAAASKKKLTRRDDSVSADESDDFGDASDAAPAESSGSEGLVVSPSKKAKKGRLFASPAAAAKATSKTSGATAKTTSKAKPVRPKPVEVDDESADDDDNDDDDDDNDDDGGSEEVAAAPTRGGRRSRATRGAAKKSYAVDLLSDSDASVSEDGEPFGKSELESDEDEFSLSE